MAQILRQCPVPELELAEPKTKATAGYVPGLQIGCVSVVGHMFIHLRGLSYISGLTIFYL